MMPDLGKIRVRGVELLRVTIVLLVGLVAASLRRARQARRALDDVEQRRKP